MSNNLEDPIELLPDRIDIVTVKGDVWTFPIDGKKLEINDVKDSKQFRQLYKDTFGIPAPIFTQETWNQFLNELQVEIEDLDEVAVDIILESIYSLPISKKPEMGIGTLYGNGMALYVPVSQVQEIITDFGIQLPTLSHALTRMGYKKRGSTLVSYGNVIKDSWELARGRWKQ
jgi:hypothetical protein